MRMMMISQCSKIASVFTTGGNKVKWKGEIEKGKQGEGEEGELRKGRGGVYVWASAFVAGAVAGQQQRGHILKFYSISGNYKILRRGASRESPLLPPSRKQIPRGGSTPLEARRSS